MTEQTPPPLDPDVLEQLDAAATPAPWQPWDRGVGWEVRTCELDEHGRPYELPEGAREGTLTEPDAKLIAALRNAAPEMTRRAREACDIAKALADAYVECERLRELIDDLRNPDPCSLDHHGYCQTHYWFETDPSCPHARAAALFPDNHPQEGR